MYAAHSAAGQPDRVSPQSSRIQMSIPFIHHPKWEALCFMVQVGCLAPITVPHFNLQKDRKACRRVCSPFKDISWDNINFHSNSFATPSCNRGWAMWSLFWRAKTLGILLLRQKGKRILGIIRN